MPNFQLILAHSAEFLFFSHIFPLIDGRLPTWKISKISRKKKKKKSPEMFFVALVYNECVCVNAHLIKTKSLALTRDIIIIPLDLSN